MKYWTFKHKQGADSTEEKTKEIVEIAIRLNSVLMQYEYGFQPSRMVTQSWNKAIEIKEGDIIFLRGDKNVHAYGKAITPLQKGDVILLAANIIRKNSHEVDGISYRSDAYNKIIYFSDSFIFYENLKDGEQEWGQRIDVDGWKYFDTKGIPVDDNQYIDNNPYPPIRELNKDYADALLNQLKTNFMGEEISILESNKNLILTGAPGTGKTYLAKQMALKMLFGKDSEDLLSDIEKEEFKKRHAFVQFHPSYDYTDFVEGLRPHKEAGKEMSFKLTNGIFKNFCKQAKDNPNKNFVFIIDEINRGELSKIFGELFYAIDPGYRGVKGKIITQYHNINEKENFVDEDLKCFYVPEKIFIIGTMNDIDRSVESFDFAIRRRFAWIEIKPEDRISMLDDLKKNKDGKLKEGEELKTAEKLIETAKQKMKNLNVVICDKDNSLGEHFQIGPAYFLKVKEYEGDFQKLWNNHLKILLTEYLRGLPKAKEELEKMKTAYDGTTID